MQQSNNKEPEQVVVVSLVIKGTPEEAYSQMSKVLNDWFCQQQAFEAPYPPGTLLLWSKLDTTTHIIPKEAYDEMIMHLHDIVQYAHTHPKGAAARARIVLNMLIPPKE